MAGASVSRAVLAAQRRAEDRHRVPCEPWRTWGEHWDPATHPHQELLRVYLACAPGTGLQTVATVTDRARRWSEPWLLSSRALQQPVPRADATVLTLPVASLDPLRHELRRLFTDLRPFLATHAPLLTLHVTRGVGIAESPGPDSSYGEHRCRIVAASVLAHREDPLRACSPGSTPGSGPRDRPSSPVPLGSTPRGSGTATGSRPEHPPTASAARSEGAGGAAA